MTRGPSRRFERAELIGEFAEETIRAYFEASGFTMDRMGIEHLQPGRIDAQTRSTERSYANEALRRRRYCRV
jgi:hypothetical protein